MICERCNDNGCKGGCPVCGAATEESPRSPGGYRSDTERLNWMIANSAIVFHASDDEFCWVEFSNRDGAFRSPTHFDSARAAIDSAMNGKLEER